jgi:hypothetical protein
MFRQLVGTQTDTEYRPARLKGGAAIKWPGVHRVESETIDEAHHCGDGVGVVARGSHGETIRLAPQSPGLVKLEVPKVVEALDHSRQREVLLDHDAGAHWCRREFLVNAVDLLPIVHSVDEDLASKCLASDPAESVHWHRQDNEVGMTDDLVGCDGASARGKDLDNEFDALGSTRPGDGNVISARNRGAGDGDTDFPRSDDPKARVASLVAGHGTTSSPSHSVRFNGVGVNRRLREKFSHPRNHLLSIQLDGRHLLFVRHAPCGVGQVESTEPE